MGKRILFVGVFSTWYSNNHPQKDAFEKAGWTVDIFDYRKEAHRHRQGLLAKWLSFLFWIPKHPLFPAVIRRLFYCEPARKKMRRQLLQKASRKRYDLIFLSKVEEVPYWLVDELNKHAPTYYYFMDPLKTARLVQATQYARRTTYASATFSDVTALFNKNGGHAKQIVQGIDPAQFSLASRVKEKKYTVIFAGTMDGRRKKFIQSLAHQGIDVQLYGKGTKNGPIFNEQLMEKYAQAKIILNLSRIGKGFSVRVFEAMATGSLLLAEYCDDLTLFFKRGVHLDWFNDEEEAIKLIKKYLADAKKREMIGARAKRLAFECYTWENQIDAILVFSGLRS